MFDICAASALILFVASIMYWRIDDAIFTATTCPEVQRLKKWERVASETMRWAGVIFIISGCFSGIELLLVVGHFS